MASRSASAINDLRDTDKSQYLGQPSSIIVYHCVVPENIHTPTTEGIGNSRGVGGSMAQEIPEGRRGEWLDNSPKGQLHIHVRHKCSKL